MSSYSFLLNLRSETLNPKILKPLSPKGFLVSPKYATGRVRENIEEFNNSGAMILADNGNFSFIDDITTNFDARSDAFIDKVVKEEKRLGHKVRPGDLSDSLLNECTSLALEVQKTANKISLANKDPLEFTPSHLIGAEDLTVAALLKLNIEPHYLNLDRNFFKNLNTGVTSQAMRHMEKLPAELSKNYYPVASAMSYDTAYDAGEVFAKAGIPKVAMGFGAYLSDRRVTDYVDIAGIRTEFQDRLPNSYIRSGIIAKGFWDGYTSFLGKPPEAFHFLGLGVPIMLGIMSLFTWETPTITFDATSPIKDAFSGTMYISHPSFLKVKNYRLSTKLANGFIEKWDCPCPFCQDFIKKYPFDYDKGTAWFQENQREVKDDDLEEESPLAKAYPLFAKLDNHSMGKEIRLARIGHNHWMLNEMMEELSSHSIDFSGLKKYMGKIVENYQKTALSANYAQAIQFLYQIATTNEND